MTPSITHMQWWRCVCVRVCVHTCCINQAFLGTLISISNRSLEHCLKGRQLISYVGKSLARFQMNTALFSCLNLLLGEFCQGSVMVICITQLLSHRSCHFHQLSLKCIIFFSMLCTNLVTYGYCVSLFGLYSSMEKASSFTSTLSYWELPNTTSLLPQGASQQLPIALQE